MHPRFPPVQRCGEAVWGMCVEEKCNDVVVMLLYPLDI